MDRSSKRKRLGIISLINGILKVSDCFEDYEIYKAALRKLYEETIQDREIKKNSKLLLGKAAYYMGQKLDVQAASNYLNQALDCSDIADNLSDAIYYAYFINQNALSNIQKIVDDNKYSFSRSYYFSLKALIAEKRGDYKDAHGFLDKSFHEGLSLANFLSNKSYYFVLESRFKEVVDLVSGFDYVLESEHFEAVVINYCYSQKCLDAKDFDKIHAMNLSAKSKSADIKICAYVLQDDLPSAKRLAEKEINKSHLNYLNYKKWPILGDKFLSSFETQKLGLSA